VIRAKGVLERGEGRDWRFRPAEIRGITVHCDHRGCTAKIVAKSYETNGAAIECIYGCNGWRLGWWHRDADGSNPKREPDLCPAHAPPPEQNEDDIPW
jgi:hypothetical protein